MHKSDGDKPGRRLLHEAVSALAFSVRNEIGKGMEKPVSVNVECFRMESQPMDIIQAYVEDSYNLTLHKF